MSCGPPYAHLANILLDRRVIEEHIQQDCRAQTVAASLEKLLSHRWMEEAQKASFRRVAKLLGDGDPPSSQAAAGVLGLLRERALPVASWTAFPPLVRSRAS